MTSDPSYMGFDLGDFDSVLFIQSEDPFGSQHGFIAGRIYFYKNGVAEYFEDASIDPKHGRLLVRLSQYLGEIKQRNLPFFKWIEKEAVDSYEKQTKSDSNG